jgi:RimJ/RimL family protein N-acetyltransferase
MIHKLIKKNYHKVKHLVENIDHQLCLIAQVEGNNFAGEIYVDDLDNPTSALIFSLECDMLLGNPNNPEFNAGLKDYIGEWAYLVCETETWETNIKDVIANADLIKAPRLHYMLTELKYKNWRDDIPEGFEVVRIDKDFFQRTDLENFSHTARYANRDGWNPELKMDEFGYGHCIIDVKNNVIASSSTIDCLYEDKIEMGIRSDYRYRRQGLAAIVVAATVEDYMSKGITRFGWQCLANNIGSFKTAEKVGFERFKEYHCFCYNRGDAENVGDFTQEEWLATAKLMESRGDLHSLDWSVYAYAATGNQEKTLYYMNYLLDHSWQYPEDQFINDQFFAPFYESEEWSKFEKRFKRICAIRKQINEDTWHKDLTKADYQNWLDKFQEDKYFSFFIASCFSHLGCEDEAIALIQEVAQNKYFGLTKELLLSWRFENLKDNPTWLAILDSL